ncbi:FHY3/FAR1 family protein [Dioscorea alata]|nr:FHY3/FAR1 family protein [Dioscorea alata]KAH7681335.1 FHY3/FAR1 family protein [Dioscorea alata]
MDSMTTLGPTLGFEIPHESDVDPLMPIHSQESHLETESLLVSAPPESLVEEQEKGIGVAMDSDTQIASVGTGDHQEPVLGMEFDSPEESRAFYSAYAARIGFGVRNSKSFTSRVDDTVIMRRFVCSRQGRPSKKDPFDLSKKRRNRVSSREGCKAMLQVNRRENGKWAVSRCVLEHCHPLGIAPKASPSLQKKLAKKPWELIVNSTNVESQQNGLGAGGGVAQSLLEYFKKMQADNPAFFYSVQVDRNNCVANLFWADARARMAYSYFGDAVVFDMTCKKNKRVVPLAAFTGVNHHRQLIVFGSAFMTDESEASFTWLFETWLALMSGRRPVSFVTAHNEAMAAASFKVFPTVRHRFCKRDIFHKCKEKLVSVYSANPSFKGEFKKCVNESESIEEFESGWKLLVGKHNLDLNGWLRTLYAIREKWAPVYFRNIFFAEISAPPKIETMHKFFLRHSITTTTLRDLVTQFDKAMAGQYEGEVQADIAGSHTRPVLKTPSPLEKQASDIYTRAIFDLFQEELVESSGFLMEKIEDGVINKFRVASIQDSSRIYLVTYNSSDKKIFCSCCMFEYSGILCRHIFRVSLAVGLAILPEDYILRRWTKNAKSNILSYEHCAMVQSNCRKALSWRCNDLCRDAIRFAEEGATSAAIYKVAKGALQKAFSEVFAAKRGPFFNGAR